MHSRHHSIQMIRRNHTAYEPQTAYEVVCWSEQFDLGETSCRGLADDDMDKCHRQERQHNGKSLPRKALEDAEKLFIGRDD